jgi:hypothetical protein
MDITNLYEIEYEFGVHGRTKLIAARSMRHALEAFDGFCRKQHYGTIAAEKLVRITRLYTNIRVAK